MAPPAPEVLTPSGLFIFEVCGSRPPSLDHEHVRALVGDVDAEPVRDERRRRGRGDELRGRSGLVEHLGDLGRRRARRGASGVSGPMITNQLVAEIAIVRRDHNQDVSRQFFFGGTGIVARPADDIGGIVVDAAIESLRSHE